LTPTIDPTLAELYQAARESKAAWPILADWLAEAGDEEAASRARIGMLHVAIRDYHGYSFGYYSAEFARRYGCSIYATPDGEEVNVTLVNAVPIVAERDGWADHAYVGKVTRMIRRNRGEMDFGTYTFGGGAVNFRPSGIVYTNLF
jgi:hypothetical protein